jgi:6-phosphogluconolactonase (cycloisomerase 2 family)
MPQPNWCLLTVLAMALALSGCASSGSSPAPGNGGGPGTGGSGGAGATQPAKFVYVPAGNGPSIIPFSVDQNTGALSKQASFQDPDNRPIGALASTPDGRFLFASEAESSGTSFTYFLQTLAVDMASGSLSPAGTISTFSAAEGMAVDPSGTMLAVGGTTDGSGNPAVGIFKINNGTLTLAAGSPLPLNGEHVFGLAWDASGTFLYASVINQSASTAEIAAFQVDRNTGTLTSLGALPAGARAREVAVAGSNFVFVAAGDQGIDAYRIQNGTLTPVPGSPFSNSSNSFFFGIAASRDGSTLYVDDTLVEQIAWYTINSDGSLTQAGSTGPGSVNPGGHIVIDQTNKFLYDAAETTTFCFTCTAAMWGATIGSGGTLTPISGAPWDTFSTSSQGRFAVVP